MRTRRLATLAVLFLAEFVATAVSANAGTNVNVNVGIPVGVVASPAPVVVAPQPAYVEEPSEMVFIPRSNVYFVPGVSVDVFFYDNRWWNRRGDRWYRSGAYNGPWMAVGPRHVPRAVYRVPADYRTVYVREKRIPYGQWKKIHGKHKEGKHGNKHVRHDD